MAMSSRGKSLTSPSRLRWAREGTRLATFPDLICTLSLETGLPVSVAQMHEGKEVAVLVNSKADLPVGTGAREPDAYPEVEAALGIDQTDGLVDAVGAGRVIGAREHGAPARALDGARDVAAVGRDQR